MNNYYHQAVDAQERQNRAMHAAEQYRLAKAHPAPQDDTHLVQQTLHRALFTAGGVLVSTGEWLKPTTPAPNPPLAGRQPTA